MCVACPPAISWTKDGIVVVGAAIGTLEFEQSFLAKKLAMVEERIAAITDLGAVEPQMATNLLRTMANVALDYVARTMRPSKLFKQAVLFDDMIQGALQRILSPSGATFPELTQAQKQRKEKLVELPCEHGGFGFTPLTVKSPLAFLAALTQTLRNQHCPVLKAGYLNSAKDALDRATRVLPQNITLPGNPMAALMSANPESLFNDVQRGRACFTNNSSKQHIQRKLMQERADEERATLRESVINPDCGMSDSERAHLLEITGTSQATRTTRADMPGRLMSLGCVLWVLFL